MREPRSTLRSVPEAGRSPMMRCAFHPKVVAVGTTRLVTEDGVQPTLVCAACLLEHGGQTPEVVVTVLHRGSPCRCGPGFCASSRGLGYFGTCTPDPKVSAAPDCAKCGAPFQSTKGCWCCSLAPCAGSVEFDDAIHEELSRTTAQLAREGIHGDTVRALEKLAVERGEPRSFRWAARQALAGVRPARRLRGKR